MRAVCLGRRQRLSALSCPAHKAPSPVSRPITAVVHDVSTNHSCGARHLDQSQLMHRAPRGCIVNGVVEPAINGGSCAAARSPLPLSFPGPDVRCCREQ